MASSAWKVEFDMRDLQEFTKSLPRAMNAAIQLAFNEVMAEVFADSQVLVPVKTGALKASGKLNIKHNLLFIREPEASITYGGPGVDYAVYVHEILTDQHAAPTQAKYLEVPMVNHIDTFVKQVRLRVQKVFDNGGMMGSGMGGFQQSSLEPSAALWNQSVGFSTNSDDSGLLPSSDDEFGSEDD